MKKLNKPNINNKDFTRGVIDRKNGVARSLLSGVLNLLYDSYDKYDEDGPSFECISNTIISDENVKNEMKKTYKHNNTLIRSVVSGANELQYCPYCDMRTPTTLDHYLPKDKFSEYSIFINNIIPCCYDCNNKKRDDFLINGERQYLHLYYDDIKNEKFLKCDIELIEDGIPVINFRVISIDGVNFELVKNHFKNLDVFRFYIEKTRSLIMSYKKCCEDGINKDKLFAIIEGELMLKKNQFGVNHYEVAFLEEFIRVYDELYDSFLL